MENNGPFLTLVVPEFANPCNTDLSSLANEAVASKSSPPVDLASRHADVVVGRLVDARPHTSQAERFPR